MTTISEERKVGPFKEIVAEGELELILTQDPEAEEKVIVTANSDLVPELKSEVQGDRLVLGYDVAWWAWPTWWLRWVTIADKNVRYHVTLKTLEGLYVRGTTKADAEKLETGPLTLDVSGAGKIRIGSLKAGWLSTRISGSGKIEIDEGSANRHEATISGSGDILTAGVQAQEAAAKISGSGKITINAQEKLDVIITGSGTVLYAGHPQLEQRVTGAGTIKPR